ncbi:MAG: ATPase [Firmicutes bacterium]|nr:ATPase [Bacillota bacterium]
MNRMNLLLLLDRLEQLIQSSPRVPLGNRCLVDTREVLDIVNKIRTALPEEVQRADRQASDSDRLIEQGQQEAERIVREAEEYVSRLVSESEVLRRAQAEAKKILEDAQRRAKELEDGADAYADGVLRNLQDALERTLRTVKKGRSELHR